MSEQWLIEQRNVLLGRVIELEAENETLRAALAHARECIASPTHPFGRGLRQDVYDRPMMSKALRQADDALAAARGGDAA
jgi:hypothetical protein